MDDVFRLAKERAWLFAFDALMFVDQLIWRRHRQPPRWLDQLELFCIQRAAKHTDFGHTEEVGPDRPWP